VLLFWKNLRRGFPVKLCFKGSGKKLLEKIANFGYVSKILKNLRRGFPVKLCFKGSGKKLLEKKIALIGFEFVSSYTL